MSDSEESNNQPPVPRAPPKIPPPPSEHPPPYTPFCTLPTSSLLPEASTSTNSTGQNNNRNPETRRVTIQPRGVRKYINQYVTTRNLILAGILIFVLIVVLIWAAASGEGSDDRKNPNFEVQHLKFTKRSIGAFKFPGQKISFDELENSIILSRYKPKNHEVQSEKFVLDDDSKEVPSKFQNVDTKYGDFEDCMKFTSEVICCSTSPHSNHHKTECFLKNEGKLVHSVASKFDFSKNWQSLEDNDDILLIVSNIQRNAVLDLKNNNIYKIEENRLPQGYASEGFFFPMDTKQTLHELVQTNDEFRICEYSKTTNNGDYILRDAECKQTHFKIDSGLPKVKFCSNPIYTAVIQYGHRFGMETLTWHIKVVYDSENIVYDTKDNLRSEYEEIALDCNNENVEIFMIGENNVIQYTVVLPSPASEHFIQQTMK